MEDEMAENIFKELWARLGWHPGSRSKWSQTLPTAKNLKHILLAIAVMVVLNLDPVQAEDQLPKGKGRDLVSKKCQRCHGLDPIQKMRGSREQWSEILDEMINNGLALNDKDRGTILEYLGTHLGPSPKK